MTSHELAATLLALPNMPVAVHVNGCSYFSLRERTHGPLMIGLARHFMGNHIIVGSMLERMANLTNWGMLELYTHKERGPIHC